jgi:hypothetical protein
MPAKLKTTPVELFVRILIDRPHLKAIRVRCGEVEAWLPKSQMTFLSRYDNMRECTITIPEWLAKEKGLLK